MTECDCAFSNVWQGQTTFATELCVIFYAKPCVTRSQAAKPDNPPMPNLQVLDVLSSVFLPSGYPESVSPGMFILKAISVFSLLVISTPFFRLSTVCNNSLFTMF